MGHDVRVKFCGLRRPEDLEHAAQLGADFLGMVFATGGPRTLSVAEAEALAAVDVGSARRVGVFRDQPVTWINQIVRRCRLDLVQLHGHEPRDYPLRVDVPVIRALYAGAMTRPGRGVDPRTSPAQGTQESLAQRSEQSTQGSGVLQPAVPPPDMPLRLAPNVFAVLVDSQTQAGESGGHGIALQPESAQRVLRSVPADARVFLAGGMRAETVGAFVTQFRPFAVDVSSGIESAPGVKDPDRMRAFMKALGRPA